MFDEIEPGCDRRAFDEDLARERTPEPLRPKIGEWDAAALLDPLTRDDVALGDLEIEELRDFFWFDLCVEYDAIHLHRHLHARGDRYSDEFLAFEAAWYRDEINHARGFHRLYRMLYGVSEERIRADLDARVPDFGPLETFFGDEFRLALLFAYDELATTRAYFVDFELYRRFGHPAFGTFIRRLVRDESFHYQNAVAVIRRLHADRLGEVPRHVEDFVAHDLGGHDYRATFLFDHEWSHIESGFFRENGEILCRRLAPRLAETGAGAPDKAR